MCCSFLFRHYFVWKAPVGTLVPMNRRVTVKHTLAILCELSDPFKGCWWPPTGGSKSHGLNHLVYGIKCHLSNGHHERQSPNASHLTSHGFPPIFGGQKSHRNLWAINHQSITLEKTHCCSVFQKLCCFFWAGAALSTVCHQVGVPNKLIELARGPSCQQVLLPIVLGEIVYQFPRHFAMDFLWKVHS